MSFPPLFLDLRGLKCPLPVLKTQQLLEKQGPLSPSSSLEVWVNDPLAPVELEALAVTYSLAWERHKKEDHDIILLKGKS